MGKFIISEKNEGEFQFNFKNKNGDIILTSETYLSKDCCKNGIQCAKNNSIIEDRYEKKISASDQFHFHLKSGNGNIIGTSQIYPTKISMDSGINYMINRAEDSSVEHEVN